MVFSQNPKRERERERERQRERERERENDINELEIVVQQFQYRPVQISKWAVQTRVCVVPLLGKVVRTR
jgi:hypothetical protein